METRDDGPLAVAEPSREIRYHRILLKLSGEALLGETQHGIDGVVLDSISSQIADIHSLGAELALVIGAGNIFRGVRGATAGMDRATADYMGMLATVFNALALQDSLERRGVKTRVMSAIEMSQVAEPYIRRRAMRHLEKGRIVIFAAGTGNPFFSTDTAASLRAAEIGAEVLLKATKVDGVYSADPKLDQDAKRFGELSYRQFLMQDLKVMDATAVQLCMENRLPIIVFNMTLVGNIQRAVFGEPIGTLVH